MNFETLVQNYSDLPVIDSQWLLAGVSNPAAVNVQLTRWRKSGKLMQLKKGLYLLAEPYRKVEIYEPYLASILQRPSYLSLEKALEFHGLIPESVPVFTSVTTKRPARFETAMGCFQYRHVQESLFWGYEAVSVRGQTAFFARPEKALLDLIYLNAIQVTPEYLEEMRFQNVDKISAKTLLSFAQRFGKKKLFQAAQTIQKTLLPSRQRRKNP